MMIKKEILKRTTPSQTDYIYIGIFLTQDHCGNGVLTSYDDESNNEIKNYKTKNNQRIAITGFCESKLNNIKVVGKTLSDSINAFNKTGEFITPYGEKYAGYSGIVSISDDEIKYVIDSKLINGVPDETYGVTYVDSISGTTTYYDDWLEENNTITRTIYKTYSYGINQNNFSYNDILYKDNRNDKLVSQLIINSDEIVVDRENKTPFTAHMILSTIKNIDLLN